MSSSRAYKRRSLSFHLLQRLCVSIVDNGDHLKSDTVSTDCTQPPDLPEFPPLSQSLTNTIVANSDDIRCFAGSRTLRVGWGRTWWSLLPDRKSVRLKHTDCHDLTNCDRFNPRMYRMLFDVVRFNLFAMDLIREEVRTGRQMSIGEYLDREGYGEAFKEDYLLASFSRSGHLIMAKTRRTAHDRRNLVHTSEHGGSRLPSINTYTIFLQS